MTVEIQRLEDGYQLDGDEVSAVVSNRRACFKVVENVEGIAAGDVFEALVELDNDE